MVNTGTNRIKILHVTQSTGGVANVITSLVSCLPEFQHSIISPPETFSSQQLRCMGLQNIDVNMVRDINPLSDYRSLIALQRTMGAHSFDIVHIHSSKAGFLARLALRLSKSVNSPVVYSPHGWAFHGYMSRSKYTLYSLLERFSARWCDYIVCVSDAELKDGLSEGLRPRRSMLRIYNGVDHSGFSNEPKTGSLRAEIGIPTEGFVFVAVGRLADQKSSVEIIEAFERISRKFPNIYLLYVGDGPLRPEVERRIMDGNLSERVKITGWVADVRPYIRASNASILISKWEAFGLAAIESLAMGVPVLTSREGALPEIVSEEVGYSVQGLIHPDSILEGLCHMIRTTFDTERCKKHAANFTLRNTIDEYRRFYTNVHLQAILSDTTLGKID